MRFKVCSLDVWGNAEDGYWVNDMFACGSIEVDKPDTDMEIRNALINSGYLNAGFDVEIDSDGNGIIYINYLEDGKPLLQLMAENKIK